MAVYDIERLVPAAIASPLAGSAVASTMMWNCTNCGRTNWDDVSLCESCQSPGPARPTLAESVWGKQPQLGDHEERLGSSPRGCAFFYSRGPHTYEVAHHLDAPPGVAKLNPRWVSYWTGPKQPAQLSEAERLDVFSRTVALLQEKGWKVEIAAD